MHAIIAPAAIQGVIVADLVKGQRVEISVE
jgi:hypothetical protein